MTFIHNTKLIFLLLAACLLAACSSSSHNAPDPEPEPDNVSTILVYMVANNNLGSSRYDYADLAEMQVAASAGHLNGGNRLLVYHSPYRGTPVLKEVKRSGNIDTLAVYDDSELSVSVARMQRVIADAKAAAPAPKFGMVLWSHASGWLQDGIAETDEAQDAPARSAVAYSYGLEGGKRMNITSLQKAMEGEGLDFVYFDCCYMGSVETLYQLRSVAPVMIAAPTEVPVKGMPYHSTLQHLFKGDYVAAARATYEYYDSVYTAYECPVSVTVVNTDKLPALAAATRAIYEQAAKPMPNGYTPQAFCLRPYYYYDFADYAKALSADLDPALWQKWSVCLDDAVAYKAAENSIWGEFPLTRFGGLSTYIFSGETDSYLNSKNYRELDWWTDVASTLIKE